MKSLKRGAALLSCLTASLVAAGCAEAPTSPDESTVEDDFFSATGLQTVPDFEQATPQAGPLLSHTAPPGATVLDFEDLEAGGWHEMPAHNPYHGIIFSGPNETSGFHHRSWAFGDAGCFVRSNPRLELCYA